MARYAPVLTKPRYEARELEAPIGHLTHGIFDTFPQDWVLAEHHTKAQAERAAQRYNDRYEETLR